MKDEFIQAIRDKTNVRITFFSKEDGRNLTRKCSPMDYGMSRRAHDGIDRYHLWDFESDTGPHTLSLPPDQLISLEVLREAFDPSTFVTWTPAWIVDRDWGEYS